MPIDYPEQTYYPSAKVRLVVRFEEFGTKVLQDKAPAKPTTKIKGASDERAPLTVIPDPDFDGRFLLTSGLANTTPGPGSAQSTSSDGLSHEISGVIPSKATWKQNGMRTADTLALTIRWQDMPIDPRVIRACSVEFFLGTVTAEEYASGIEGISRGDVYGPGVANAKEPLNLIPDTYFDGSKQRTNLRFTGWVDKWKLSSGDGLATLELECTDNTRILEKQVRPPKLPLGMDKRIDEAVAEYLANFPQMEGLTVEYLPRDTDPEDIPKLEGVLHGSAFVPKLGGPPASGGGATSGNSETVLDYLTSVVGSIAHSMRIDGTRVVIQRASNLLGSVEPRSDDVYQGRNLPSGRFPVRAFIYGKNVDDYSIDREFTQKASTNVEVRSYDPERKNVVVARFPEKGDRQLVNSPPGDGKADKKWKVIQVADGIRDKDTLKAVAEEYFNSVGRQELIVHVKTKNLASFGGGNEDPDLLDMTTGDAFELLVNRGEAEEGTLTEMEKNLASVELNKQTMTGLGFSADFAAAYAKAFSNAGFQREYKLKEMSVMWDTESGVSFEITGANYIVVRVDQPLADRPNDIEL